MSKRKHYIILFLLLVLLQVFVLDNILFLDYINPHLYIAFIFLYPLDEKRFLFLLTSFFLGLTIDFFTDSGGINAFATLTIAYIRLFFVKLYFRKYEADFPFFNLHSESFGKVFNYVVTLTLIHHFVLFSFANYSFQNMRQVVLHTLFSGVFTLILYFLGVYVFSKKE